MRAPPAVEEKPSSDVQRNLRQVDYSEYEWMEDQELFDRQIMAQLDEEAFYEECLSEIIEEEQLQQQWEELHIIDCSLDEYSQFDLEQLPSLAIISAADDICEKSQLNPEAPEFFPRNCCVESTYLQHSQNIYHSSSP